MPSPIPTTTRGKNLDRLIKMHGLANSTTDEEPIASMKANRKKKIKMKTKSVRINNLPPNKDITGTSTASTNNQSVSKNTSVDNVGGIAHVSATTHGTNLNNNGIANALSITVASTSNSLGVSATVTAATANATIPGDAANVKLPKKGRRKKATMTASPTCRNPKHKKYLDDATIDTNFPKFSGSGGSCAESYLQLGTSNRL
jgi:hypothetical protein